MVISLEPELETALNSAANELGKDPETLVLKTLRERFLPLSERLEPRDEWERRLLSAASDCGVSLSDRALGREEIYD